MTSQQIDRRTEGLRTLASMIAAAHNRRRREPGTSGASIQEARDGRRTELPKANERVG